MSENPSRDEVLRVLADPIRWRFVRLFGTGDELACGVLQQALPVTKPTISYHAGVLARAGLIGVRRHGRRVTYTLNREVLQGVVQDIATLLPETPAHPEVAALPTW